MSSAALRGTSTHAGTPITSCSREGVGEEGEARLLARRAAPRFSAERCLPGGGRSCVGPDTNLPLQAAALLPGAGQTGGGGEAGAKPPEISR